MRRINSVEKITGKKHIALLDTSSISFMQGLREKGIAAETILEDYDLILIPEWVLTEVNDAKGRMQYVQTLCDEGYPIYSIAEEAYSDLVDYEEGNLYHIVLASVYQIARLRSYLRRFVEKTDPLDMDSYKEWINKLYREWPIPGPVLSGGRIKKKNAGEVSITILAEVLSWYYPDIETLTIYSQDSDLYEFQCKAEAVLKDFLTSKMPVHVSYKSNDAILYQLYREGKIAIKDIEKYRKDKRRVIYSKEREDHSVILVTETVDHDSFRDIIQNHSVHIIF